MNPDSDSFSTTPSVGRLIQHLVSVAVLLATIFITFSPRLFLGDFGATILALLTPQPVSDVSGAATRQAIRIGIVSGHWSNSEDQGAVCEDGTTEAAVNYKIASLAAQMLEAQGYTVDLLQEFDSRLQGYRAAALVSIHNDSCVDQGPDASGYKVVAALGTHDRNLANRLVACLTDRYGRTTGLKFHPGSITRDMTEYHAFDEIDPATTAAIIETGFLYRDYQLLTTQPGLVAQGVVNGILCFLRNENVDLNFRP
ncbi:MAG: N-acetylmuramoyl-L-alanine amidase [Anaerolineales bacterium]|nr:N-acetylmuramoyl-L-alanine amidase [Anaerolineales bacterium]MCX7607778.1 N-acetylmuramoyl-L-alanine amidase [Anaerolineales bacterium]MDW8227018.1 N-acetylmuramoyl-L-alanine amidase [Anaerolineales bacterium]